jgi:hypothetical protein
MDNHSKTILISTSIFFLFACDSANLNTKDNALLQGKWEVALSTTTSPEGTISKKGQVEFTDDNYIYRWYQKFTNLEGQTIVDWSLSSQEIGTYEAINDEMKWTVSSHGSAQFDSQTNRWGVPQMQPATVNYDISYSLEGNQLILQEDNNLDGDFDDKEPTPETLIYQRLSY